MHKDSRAMHNGQRGFTLLELLITITIIAILSVVLIIVLNPAETLKKSRDTQRLSDLSTLKTALGLYLTTVSTPILSSASGVASNTPCKTGGGGGNYSAGDKVHYSVASSSATTITDSTLDGGSGSTPSAYQVRAANLGDTDGRGWVPVNLASVSGGTPISNMPIDPVNTIANYTSVASTDLVYRYVCNETFLTFEIDAQLESQAFTVDDDKRTKDGGNNSQYFEAGTNLKLLGTGTDF